MRATLYFRFDDEAAAIAALAAYRVEGEEGEVWDGSRVDAGVPITLTPAVLDEAGEVVTPAVMSPHYHVNLLLNERDEEVEALPGLIGVMEEQAGSWVLVSGERPKSPQRVFA